MEQTQDVHAINDYFTTAFEDLVDLTHDVASSGIDDGTEQRVVRVTRTLIMLLQDLRQIIWPILYEPEKSNSITSSTTNRPIGSLTLFIIHATLSAQRDSFPDLLFRPRRHIHVRSSCKTQLKSDKSDTTAYTCDEHVLALSDVRVDYSRSASEWG